jgi:hypothetical protein
MKIFSLVLIAALNTSTAFAYEAMGLEKFPTETAPAKLIATSSPSLANSLARNWRCANPTVSRNMLVAIRVRSDNFPCDQQSRRPQWAASHVRRSPHSPKVLVSRSVPIQGVVLSVFDGTSRIWRSQRWRNSCATSADTHSDRRPWAQSTASSPL